MLQRSGFPTQVTTEQLTATLQRSLSGRWLEALQPYIWLPSTPGQFLATLAMGLLITTGLMVHVYLSVQVQIARYELYDAREAYETVGLTAQCRIHLRHCPKGVADRAATGRAPQATCL